MRRFADLTGIGQVRRLRRLVDSLLEAYDFDVTSVRLLAVHTNTLFRVRLADGTSVVVRVGDPHGNTRDNVDVEVAWLAHLSRRGFSVPQVVENRHGESVSAVDASGVDGPRVCVVFEWIPGVAIGERATPADYQQLGEISARLHHEGGGLDPPKPPRVWDRVFYYPEELDPVVVWDPTFDHVFDSERRRLIEEVIGRADPLLSRLACSEDARLVHGDLHPWNVHRSRGGRLHVLDFEDVMVAAPIQDVAVSLFYNRDRVDHPDLVAAFRKGYETQASWPDEDPTVIPTIMAARTVMFMNYVAKDPDEAFFERAAERLRQFVARPDVIPLL